VPYLSRIELKRRTLYRLYPRRPIRVLARSTNPLTPSVKLVDLPARSPSRNKKPSSFFKRVISNKRTAPERCRFCPPPNLFPGIPKEFRKCDPHPVRQLTVPNFSSNGMSDHPHHAPQHKQCAEGCAPSPQPFSFVSQEFILNFIRASNLKGAPLP